MIKLLINSEPHWVDSRNFVLSEANQLGQLCIVEGSLYLRTFGKTLVAVDAVELLHDDGQLFEKPAPFWLKQTVLPAVLFARAFHVRHLFRSRAIGITHVPDCRWWKALLGCAHFLFKHRARDLLVLLYCDLAIGGRLVTMYSFFGTDPVAQHFFVIQQLKRRGSLSARDLWRCDGPLSAELICRLELFHDCCTEDVKHHVGAPAWFLRRMLVFDSALDLTLLRAQLCDDPILNEVFFPNSQQCKTPLRSVAQVVGCKFVPVFAEYADLRIVIDLAIATGNPQYLECLSEHPYALHVGRIVFFAHHFGEGAPAIVQRSRK